MGREEGGGFRMGNTCIPVADSFSYRSGDQKFQIKVPVDSIPGES